MDPLDTVPASVAKAAWDAGYARTLTGVLDDERTINALISEWGDAIVYFQQGAQQAVEDAKRQQAKGGPA